jgi:hypothetical protein
VQTAVFVAVKNKMDLAIGVALGSSIQAQFSLSSLSSQALLNPCCMPACAC